MIIKTIDELTELWKEDSKMDSTEPSLEMSRIPNLHSKYLSIMSKENLIIKKLDSEYKQLKKKKWEYYKHGALDEEEIKEYKRFDARQKNILRQDISIYLDADEELTNLLLKKSLHETMVEYCQSILRELQNRTYQLNGIIKWELFKNGSG